MLDARPCSQMQMRSEVPHMIRGPSFGSGAVAQGSGLGEGADTLGLIQAVPSSVIISPPISAFRHIHHVRGVRVACGVVQSC
jgi:hypothetical protein